MHISRMKKYICMSLLFALLLTACGLPETVAKNDPSNGTQVAKSFGVQKDDEKKTSEKTETNEPVDLSDAGESDIVYRSSEASSEKWDGNSKHDVYNGSVYKIVFELKDSWPGGFTGNIAIVNTGDKVLKNWSLKFNYGGKLSNVWNAKVTGSKDKGYTAANADWNKDIEPGKSVEFGMSEQTDFAGFPTGYQLIVDSDDGGTQDLPSSQDTSGNPDTSVPSDQGGNSTDPNATATPGTDGQDATEADDDADSDVSGAVVSGTVKKHGRLKVKGKHIVDAHGKKFLIKGPSTHGIAWFPDFVNKSAFKTCKKWGANTVRLACYSSEGEGYNTTTCWKTIDRGVKAATELGMYVIIDWHILNENKPMMSYGRAKAFFKHFAKKYGKRKNIIWEICNEPNGCTWGDIKPYAKKIIPLIRKFSKNIIVVGTPTWSQDVDVVAGDRLTGKYKKNVCYTLHFYAATHKDDLRNRVKIAISKGLPILCTEFSICEASGAGTLDKSSGNAWISLFRKHGIGYVSWSLCNKDEAASLIRSDCQKTGGWKKSDLSETGKWVVKKWK